jgi:hypothetical protein
LYFPSIQKNHRSEVSTMTRPSAQGTNHRKPRSASLLSEVLEKKLSNYAIAAGSAGVALLAFAHSAEAKIVFTKTNLVVADNGGLVELDINGDGQADFGLSAGSFRAEKHRKSCSICTYAGSNLKVVPAQAGNEVWQAGTLYGNGSHHASACAEDVAAGVRIGPLRPFAPGPAQLFDNSDLFQGEIYRCPWRYYPHLKPYLAVKFLDMNGQTHFGWIRISPFNSTFKILVEGYAYETTPNTPIVAGQTSSADEKARLMDPSTDFTKKPIEPVSLGRLAQGASGITAWRREEEVLAN